MSNERRKVPRYFAELTAILTNYESGVSQEVQVEVLSVQGCCVRGSGIPESGKNCRLLFRWKGDEFRAEAQVVWKEAGRRLREYLDSTSLGTMCKIARDIGIGKPPDSRFIDAI